MLRTCLVGLASLLTLALAHPASEGSFHLTGRDGKPFPLRIMPLGASITNGFRSTDHNGYRKSLREQLRYEGWQVNMVGSLKNGTMHDKACHHVLENEGHVGWVVSQIQKASEEHAIPLAPNVILINAGTNDAQSKEVASTGERMNKLLGQLFDSLPNTTVVLSTLIPNLHVQSKVDEVNTQYRKIAAARRSNKKKLILAEMSNFIKSEDIHKDDGTHPTDHGYKKMASVWWAAIKEAEKENLLSKPEKYKDTIPPDDADPAKDPGLPAFTPPSQP